MNRPVRRFDSKSGEAAALIRWAYEDDPAAATAPARGGFLARFENQVDPDRRLDPAERDKRARRLMRAHMITIARKRRKPTPLKAVGEEPS